jgi:DNA polymerase I
MLLLIDLSNLMYRCYYAYPEMSTSGINLNAVYGTMKQILKFKENYSHILILGDSPGVTFRKEIYTEYKANRKEMPSNLKEQFQLVYKLLEIMKINTLNLENYEADDLIASAVKKYQKDIEIHVYSSDKDLMQLVNQNVKVLNPKGIIFDEIKVTEKFGVAPSQILDYLTIVGDSSDNIPGVSGIGAKGASKLLMEFDSIDSILKKCKKEKVLEKFHKSDINLSKKLIELVDNLDISLELPDLIFSINDEISSEFKRLNFKSLL